MSTCVALARVLGLFPTHTHTHRLLSGVMFVCGCAGAGAAVCRWFCHSTETQDKQHNGHTRAHVQTRRSLSTVSFSHSPSLVPKMVSIYTVCRDSNAMGFY